MIKDIKASELINTPEFVREPVDKLCKKIENSDAKRIILSGRGTGKSVVLCASEKNSLESDNLSIYQMYESAGKGINYSQLDQKLVEQYYELVFSQHLLSYIRYNKSEAFQRYEELYSEIDNRRRNVLQFILYGKAYSGVKYGSLDIKQGDYTSKILDYLKETFDKDKLTLMIDRFDWMDNTRKTPQESISKYFDMFDKVIITADDETLLEQKNHDGLIQKGYSFVDIDYGKEVSVVREIIQKRIQLHNMGLDKTETPFPEDIITNEIYQSLINKTNGNLKIMLSSMRKLLMMFYRSDFDIEKYAAMAIDEAVANAQKIKEIDACPPKFYL